MALDNSSEKYLDLNKLVIGFLSILIPISSTLAGCMTYQFIHYLNTKSFIQAQDEKKLSNQFRQSVLLHHHDYHRNSQPGRNPSTEEKNEVMFEFRRGTTNSIAEQYHGSKILSNSDPENSTPGRRSRQTCFEPIYQLLTFFNDKLNIIVFSLWVSTLFGVALEILIFKSLAQNILIDSGLTEVYGWPLVTLVIINFLISTGTRTYFARLASTMLKSPKFFLIFSLILFFMSLSGTIFRLVLVGKHLINYDEIANIPKLDDDEPQGITYDKFFSLIGIDKISLDLLQIVWLGPALIWDLLISVVLLANCLDTRKRCRFGAVDGKCSLALLLLFETLLLVALFNFVIFCSLLILGGTAGIDFERLSTISAGLNSFLSKLCTISTFCSLQHKVNERLRLGQKYINSQRSQVANASGLDLGCGAGARGWIIERDDPGLSVSSIQVPDFPEEEVEVLQDNEIDSMGLDFDDDDQSIDENIRIEGRASSAYQAEELSSTNYPLDRNIHGSDRFDRSHHHDLRLGSLVENSSLPLPAQAKIRSKQEVCEVWAPRSIGGLMSESPAGIEPITDFKHLNEHSPGILQVYGTSHHTHPRQFQVHPDPASASSILAPKSSLQSRRSVP